MCNISTPRWKNFFSTFNAFSLILENLTNEYTKRDKLHFVTDKKYTLLLDKHIPLSLTTIFFQTSYIISRSILQMQISLKRQSVLGWLTKIIIEIIIITIIKSYSVYNVVSVREEFIPN